MDLNIKFGESCVCETVYIKLDAPDTLLLSENVCHTLKIVNCHPNVQSASDDAELDNQPNVQLVARPSVAGSGQGKSRNSKKAKIRLIQTVCLPADSSAVVQVRVKKINWH